MTQQKIKETTLQPPKSDEKMLVVPRADLITDGGWHGIKQVDFDNYLLVINQKKQFLWRSEMEQNPSYKQIIPYLIFTHNNRYFLMQRRSTASETRLRNKYSLGIGGHIRQEDMASASIFDWARREFHEEVNYQDTLEIEPLGILNDDTNPVGQVHLGFVLLLKGKSDAISIKSELANGQLVTLDECIEHKSAMESWSQLVVDTLAEQYRR